VLGVGVAPCRAKFSSRSGAASASRNALLSRVTAAGAIPGGPTRNTFGAALNPGSVSASAGHSGAVGRRAGLVTARVRIFPARVGPKAAAALITPIGTCPLIRSGIIAAAPL
jgi:hypothetical protein